MRRKILYIIPTLDRCGAEKQLTLLASNLPQDKFDVRVVVLTRNGPYSQDLCKAGIKVDIIGKKSKLSFSAYYKLKRLIKEFAPDIVHTWLFAANAYGRQAAFSCKVPIVICGERCLDPWKSKWQGWIDRKLEKKTDAFAVNSTGIVDFYVQRGIPREKFCVIPNAAPLPSLPPSDKTILKQRLLQQLVPIIENQSHKFSTKNNLFAKINASPVPIGSRDGLPFIIGVVARLWPQKRVRDALWAADQLKFANLNFYLLIIGDGPEREDLLRYRDDLKLQDRVFFLGERDDVQSLLPCFDLLWNCSAYEGQSNSILEALGFGVPVVASDVPGNRDLIKTGQNGLLISEFNGDETRRRTAFSRETLSLLNKANQDLLEKMGINARQTIKESFSLNQMIKRHILLYDNLLKSKLSNSDII